MTTTELIEIARECGASITNLPDRLVIADISFLPEELQQFAQRIEQPHLQRILELTQRAEKVADSLEQAEKRLTEIAFKACANLDTKDAQIAQLREALRDAETFVASHCNDESKEGWLAIGELLKIRKALEESQ